LIAIRYKIKSEKTIAVCSFLRHFKVVENSYLSESEGKYMAAFAQYNKYLIAGSQTGNTQLYKVF
jgi:hypothetical protein